MSRRRVETPSCFSVRYPADLQAVKSTGDIKYQPGRRSLAINNGTTNARIGRTDTSSKPTASQLHRQDARTAVSLFVVMKTCTDKLF